MIQYSQVQICTKLLIRKEVRIIIVKQNIAKFNNNNCKNVIHNLNQGITITDAFTQEIKNNRHNPNKINSIEYRNDKYYWIFKLLEIEQNKFITYDPDITGC